MDPAYLLDPDAWVDRLVHDGAATTEEEAR